MNPDQKLGFRIKQRRRQMRLTQSDLGGNDFSKSFISQVEKGVTRPSLESLRIIASRLGKPLRFFLDDDHDRRDYAVDTAYVTAMSTARRAHVQGTYSQALDNYSDALQLCPPDHVANVAIILRYVAHVHHQMGDTETAIDQLTEAMTRVEQSGMSELQIPLGIDLGHMYMHGGNYREARRTFAKVAIIVDTMPIVDTHQRLAVMYGLADASYQAGLIDESRQTLEDAIESSVELGETYLLGHLCQLMVKVCQSLSDRRGERRFTLMLQQIQRLVGSDVDETPLPGAVPGA